MQSKCNVVGVSRKDPKLASAVVASHFDARWSRIQKKQNGATAYVCKERSRNKVLPGCHYLEMGHKRILQSV